MNVLVVDDDRASLLILKRVVETLGYSCTAAKDGSQAWTHFEQFPYDVVVSDWNMPGMDGIELCRRVRALQPQLSTYPYFMFTTSFDENDRFQEAMDSGADDFLSKPLRHIELKARLRVADRITTLYKEVVEQRQELERVRQYRQQ